MITLSVWRGRDTALLAIRNMGYVGSSPATCTRLPHTISGIWPAGHLPQHEIDVARKVREQHSPGVILIATASARAGTTCP